MELTGSNSSPGQVPRAQKDFRGSHVEAALDGAKDVHPSGEIIKLPCYCPWKEHLFELEEEKGTNPLPKYALFEDLLRRVEDSGDSPHPQLVREP